MTIFEIASIIVPTITAAVVLVAGIVLARREKGREEQRNSIATQLKDHRETLDRKLKEMHADIKHVDDCVDDLKERVLSNMVTKPELTTQASEMRTALHEQGLRIGLDTNGLHERIFRLENHAFKALSE